MEYNDIHTWVGTLNELLDDMQYFLLNYNDRLSNSMHSSYNRDRVITQFVCTFGNDLFLSLRTLIQIQKIIKDWGRNRNYHCPWTCNSCFRYLYLTVQNNIKEFTITRYKSVGSDIKLSGSSTNNLDARKFQISFQKRGFNTFYFIIKLDGTKKMVSTNAYRYPIKILKYKDLNYQDNCPIKLKCICLQLILNLSSTSRKNTDVIKFKRRNGVKILNLSTYKLGDEINNKLNPIPKIIIKHRRWLYLAKSCVIQIGYLHLNIWVSRSTPAPVVVVAARTAAAARAASLQPPEAGRDNSPQVPEARLKSHTNCNPKCGKFGQKLDEFSSGPLEATRKLAENET